MHAAILWVRRAFDAAGTRRRRPCGSKLSLETLETKALLSAVPYPYSVVPTTAPTPVMSQTQNAAPVAYQPVGAPTSPPGHARGGRAHAPSGMVSKAPHFYENYTGPKLAELDAVKASVKLSPSNTFQFMGVNKGVISQNVPGLFTFGVDRNGNLPPGPFPNRPNVAFDSVVVASVNPGSAPSGLVVDLANNTATPLPAGAVSVHGRSVTINVPASLLPSTGLAPSQYRFNYWPETPPGKLAPYVASFLPEFGTAQVGVGRGRR